ncbi:hypothetical protein [Thalassolituus sp.]|uniref:hypothetical protein n=1 Tax=Thalassolituus sp. TaxID=2030822 RepID=UPI00243A2A3E|nr:hypothetical protein [Thalassolituus sp.]
MKGFLLSLSIATLVSCTQMPATQPAQNEQPNTVSVAAESCIGTTDLAAPLRDSFVPAVDSDLLNAALGEPGKGGLCQGQVYISTGIKTVTLYRAWNSTNPGSTYGNWWAFNKPSGKVAQYREDFEICYQWSPLDKLVTCELKAGTKVVVGNGQSAYCSEYLTYSVSASQQVYINDASNSVMNCETADGVLVWQ